MFPQLPDVIVNGSDEAVDAQMKRSATANLGSGLANDEIAPAA
jgi:hypothetical protein